jgi:hypothetical protein
MLSKISFYIYLKSILWVHHIEAIHHPMSKGPRMIVLPLWNIKDSLPRHPNSPNFSLFLWPILDFPFTFILNEITFFQMLYRHLKCLLFSLMKVKKNPMWAKFYQRPKIPKIFTLIFFLHCNKTHGFCHTNFFMYIST